MTPLPFRKPWRSPRIRSLATAAAVAASVAVAAPASAQVAVEGALLSDYRVRGYSMSDGHPAASLSLSYDDPSGLYVGGTAAGSYHDGEPEIAGLIANAGYALRLGRGASLDAGVSRAEYYYAYGGRHLGYTEFYFGVAGPRVSARLHYSPDYYRSRTSTLYAEVDGGIEPATGWLLSAHAGVFRFLSAPPVFLPRERYDWRLGAARKFGATALHLDLSGRIQGNPARQATDATALVLSLTHGF
jgi:uncharacterized protein (TIGR02001 family)